MTNIHINKITQADTIAMQRPHEHEHYELYFLHKGEVIYCLNDVSFTVPVGAIVVVPPKAKHMTRTKTFERTIIRALPKVLSAYQINVLERLFAYKAYPIKSQVFEQINFCFELMHKIAENDTFYDDKTSSILSYIIYLLDVDSKDKILTPVPQKKLPIMVYVIIEFIEQNYSKKLSLEMIAEHFNYSVSHIKTQFKKHNDRSIYDYVLDVRISHVKQLLLETNFKIEKIAELCGFPSGNYLSLIFKKKEGFSPREYKKLINS